MVFGLKEFIILLRRNFFVTKNILQIIKNRKKSISICEMLVINDKRNDVISSFDFVYDKFRVLFFNHVFRKQFYRRSLV